MSGPEAQAVSPYSGAAVLSCVGIDEFAGRLGDGVVASGGVGGCEGVCVSAGRVGGGCEDVCVSAGRAGGGWGDVCVPVDESAGGVCGDIGCGVTSVYESGAKGWAGSW